MKAAKLGAIRAIGFICFFVGATESLCEFRHEQFSSFLQKLWVGRITLIRVNESKLINKGSY